MTPRISRVLIVAVVTTLAAGTLGCGAMNKAQNLVNNAQVLSDFADRLGKANTLTYTADYTTPDGATVTLVQQPPNTAYIAKDSRFIFTKDAIFLCSPSVAQGVLACQKSPNSQSTMDASDAQYIGALGGPGFVTPEVALGLILVASLVPGAKVEQSTKTIAGENAKCATATGLEAAATPGETDVVKEFTVCVTDAGILGSFSGTSTTGEHRGIELTRYSGTVDVSLFAPPAGAKIIDVTQIQPVLTGP
jgi:hypothetical protein